MLSRTGLRHAYHRGRDAVRRRLTPLGPRRLGRTIRWLWGVLRTIRRRRGERRLTVAIDVAAFWVPLTGIGWYLYRLLERLAERDDVRLRLYGPNLIDTPDLPQTVTSPPQGPAIEWVRYEVPRDLSFGYVWLVNWLRRRSDRLVALDGNDVLFAPNFYLPSWFDRARGAVVATVHDLGFRKVPGTLRESTRQELETNLERTLERASRVLTDAETVREELLESGLVDAGRVEAIHLGPAIATALSQPALSQSSSLPPGEGGAAPEIAVDVSALPDGTPERFVLHVGTLEPRKNLTTLLEAWRRLGEGPGPTVPLVLCGGLGWKTEELEPLIAEGTREGRLRHLGYLADAEVATLYRRATLVVLASVYEGFGLPALEAMSVGTPVVLSDIPVLREVAGEAAVYVPPDDPAAWATTVAELLADDGRREALGRRGLDRCRRFDWNETAERTVAAWRTARRDE